jgi:putative thioredoxin
LQTNIVTVTPENAKAVLIDESFIRPVVIDFWADWCAPCKALMPILEKLANEYNGDFLLAKVNADEEQMITQQFAVQSLPTVMVMKDGQPVDGFMGAQPEKEVRRILEKYLPKPWDKAFKQGVEFLQAGDSAQAMPLLKEAYIASSHQADIACYLAMAYVDMKRLDEADEVLKLVRLVDQGIEYQQAKAQLELAKSAEKAPEISLLEQQLAADPNNAEVKFQLAVQYSQNHYHRDALSLLHELLQQSLTARDGEVRRVFTDVLAVLGKSDPLAVEFQRKLYSLLY